MAGPAGPGARLGRGERLRAGAALERLFRRGARVERTSFFLLWVPGPGPRGAAFAAGRRLGGSVVRNRARRRLREAYRRQKHLLPREGVQVCFVARRGVLTMPFDEIAGEMEAGLRAAARRLGR